MASDIGPFELARQTALFLLLVASGMQVALVIKNLDDESDAGGSHSPLAGRDDERGISRRSAAQGKEVTSEKLVTSQRMLGTVPTARRLKWPVLRGILERPVSDGLGHRTSLLSEACDCAQWSSACFCEEFRVGCR